MFFQVCPSSHLLSLSELLQDCVLCTDRFGPSLAPHTFQPPLFLSPPIHYSNHNTQPVFFLPKRLTCNVFRRKTSKCVRSSCGFLRQALQGAMPAVAQPVSCCCCCCCCAYHRIAHGVAKQNMIRIRVFTSPKLQFQDNTSSKIQLCPSRMPCPRDYFYFSVVFPPRTLCLCPCKRASF